MLRSRAAWINSRPGTRWRSLPSVPFSGYWKSFKYQGGYYIGLSVISPSSYICWSTDLITWNVTVTGHILTDIACDGTYIFCTTDNIFGSAGVIRFPIATPWNSYGYNITPGLNTKTIDWSSGVGKFIIGAVGAVVYNTTATGTAWSSPIALTSSNYAPIQGAQTDSGIYGLLAQDATPFNGGVQLFTINSALSHSGLTMVSGSLEYTAAGIVPIPGTNAPLYVYKINDNVNKTTNFKTAANRILSPPSVPIPLPGFEKNFTIPYTTEKPICITNSPTAGNVYVIFESGQVWQSLDYGTSWSKTFTVAAGTRLAASGPLGIAIVQPSGQLLVSP